MRLVLLVSFFPIREAKGVCFLFVISTAVEDLSLIIIIKRQMAPTFFLDKLSGRVSVRGVQPQFVARRQRRRRPRKTCGVRH